MFRVNLERYELHAVLEAVGWVKGASDPAAAQLEKWKKSADEAEALLARSVVEIGVGAALGSSGRWYFCFVVAALVE